MRRFVMTVAACAGLAACDAGNETTASGTGIADPAVDYAARYADTAPTFDAQLNAVSLEHPGFKGIVGSEDGTEIIVLMDRPAPQAHGTSAHARLTSALSSRLGIAPGALTFAEPAVAQARGGFGQTIPVAERPDFHVLYNVKTGLRRFLFETDLVNRLDLDEATGRVTVGTTSSADAEQVRAAMTPEELAVTDFVTTQPFRAATAVVGGATSTSDAPPSMPNRSLLHSAFRPLIAGPQTEYRTQAGQGTSCSQGPAVRYGTGSLYGFLTNSHCTIVRDQVTNVRFFQPTVALSDFIGNEADESEYRSVWGGFLHKNGFYSDAAFVQTQQNIGLRGQMTSADGCVGAPDCFENGVITDIVGTASYLPVNTPVFKTGYKTGTTAGLITRTCADEDDLEGTLHLCQSVVRYAPGVSNTTFIVNGGDSGSAVLVRSGMLGSNQGVLAGLLWGANPTNQEFIFSPWENIWQQERAGTAYGLPVQAVTSAQGVVSNTTYLSPGTLPPTTPPGGGSTGGGDGDGGCPPGPPGTWTPTRTAEPC